jgi:hypothetical protein
MVADNQDLESKNFIEAVKLLNDWNKWFIAIETAVIGIIGALFKLDDKVNILAKPIGYFITGCAITTIVCFVTSIILSMTLLMSFPFFAEGRQTKDGRPLRLMDHEVTHRKKRGLPVWFYTRSLYRLFVIGMITFAASIILLPFAGK